MPAYIFECYSQATYDIEADNEYDAWKQFEEESFGQEWDNISCECVQFAEEDEDD